jgi:predicted RNase H-like HicB family nuclease
MSAASADQRSLASLGSEDIERAVRNEQGTPPPIVKFGIADLTIDPRMRHQRRIGQKLLSLRSFSSSVGRRKIRHMKFRVEIEQEEDGRWIAEVVDLPGVLAYGTTSNEAKAKVQALALRVVADRLEHGEAGADLVSISFAAA